MSELPLEFPCVADSSIQDEAAGAAEGRELSDDELVATLRQAAEQGWWPARSIVRLVTRRIEEAELALLRMGQELPGDAPSRL